MKILIIKVAAIGDYLLTTPAIRALKKGNKDAQLLMVAGQSIETAVEKNPYLDRIYLVDDRKIFHGNFFQRVGEVLRISAVLRAERIDVGLNFHRDWRFNIILYLASVKRRIGFLRKRRYFLTDAVKVEGIKHHVFHYCDLLKPLGIVCLDFKLEFPIDPKLAAAVSERFLDPHRLSDFVAVAPGGAVNVKEEMAIRRWGSERFSQLVHLLLQHGLKVVLLGSADDWKIARVIKEQNPGCIDYTGITSLKEAAAIIQKARVLICNDSGLMHLAEAVGTRVIAIFGPTHPDEKRPLSAGNIAVWKGEKLICSPCYHNGKFPVHCTHLSCFSRIRPEEIFNLVMDFLVQSEGSRL